MPQPGGVKQVNVAKWRGCDATRDDTMPHKPEAHHHPAGRGIARLCRTRTEPAEIRAQPNHSGGRKVLRGPEELPAGAMVAIVRPLGVREFRRQKTRTFARQNKGIDHSHLDAKHQDDQPGQKIVIAIEFHRTSPFPWPSPRVTHEDKRVSQPIYRAAALRESSSDRGRLACPRMTHTRQATRMPIARIVRRPGLDDAWTRVRTLCLRPLKPAQPSATIALHERSAVPSQTERPAHGLP